LTAEGGWGSLKKGTGNFDEDVTIQAEHTAVEMMRRLFSALETCLVPQRIGENYNINQTKEAIAIA
jgi:hypothetical protein